MQLENDRFSIKASAPLASPVEASNAYAAYATSVVLPAAEQPTVSCIEAYLKMPRHSWGAQGGCRACACLEWR